MMAAGAVHHELEAWPTSSMRCTTLVVQCTTSSVPQLQLPPLQLLSHAPPTSEQSCEQRPPLHVNVQVAPAAQCCVQLPPAHPKVQLSPAAQVCVQLPPKQSRSQGFAVHVSVQPPWGQVSSALPELLDVPPLDVVPPSPEPPLDEVAPRELLVDPLVPPDEVAPLDPLLVPPLVPPVDVPAEHASSTPESTVTQKANPRSMFSPPPRLEPIALRVPRLSRENVGN
jgi:hypothetical protein